MKYTVQIEPSEEGFAVSVLGAACATLLLTAWLGGRRLAVRLQTLRDNLAYLLDRGAPSSSGSPTGGDEIQALSDRLNKAIFRGRERETQMRRSVSGRTYRIVVQLLAGCRMARPVTADDSREAGRVGEAPGLLWAVLGGGHRVSHHIDLDSFQNQVDGDLEAA